MTVKLLASFQEPQTDKEKNIQGQLKELFHIFRDVPFYNIFLLANDTIDKADLIKIELNINKTEPRHSIQYYIDIDQIENIHFINDKSAFILCKNCSLDIEFNVQNILVCIHKII
jgi:hypothetical protein